MDRLLGVATRSYLQGQWNSALDALDAAAELIPSADILFNRAQTCREAGEERAALSLYEQAAQQASDATLKTAASKRASELRARLSVKAGLAALSEQEQRLARQQELIQKVQRELAATKVAPPLHKRWWLWTAVGGAVAAVVVVSAVTAYELPRQPIYPNFQVVMLR